MLLGLAGSARAQALPFHAASGITAGFQENVARAFVSFGGRAGLARDGRRVPDPLDREIRALTVVGGAIPVAFAPLWTVRVSVPLVRRSMAYTGQQGDRAHLRVAGIGDVVVDAKWAFFSRNRPAAATRIALQAGIKLPVGRTDARLPTGEPAPRSLQAGTGSWDFPVRLILTETRGRWGLHGNLGYTVTTAHAGFEAGDALAYDGAVGFRILPRSYEGLRDQTVVVYLEGNGTVVGRSRAGALADPDSGGHLLFLSPDLQWIPTPWLLFEGSVQLPVVQELNGEQLRHRARVQLGTRIRFSAFR